MRGAILIAIGLALTGSALAAQDTGSPYDAAVAAHRAGESERAVRLLEPLVAAHPEDVDARVQLGYAYLALDRREEAREQFRAVLERAPDYDDARAGLAIIDGRRRTDTKAHSSLHIEGAISDLTGGRDDWSEIGATVAFPVASHDTLALSATLLDRFGLHDTELSAEYTMRAEDDVWLRGGLSTTPSADFRPSIGLSTGIDWRMTSGRNATIIGFEGSWRSFPLQDVWTFTPSVTQYLTGGEASITARVDGIAAEDNPIRIGALVRADLYPSEGARVFVGAASGPDTDIGVVTTRSSVFGGAELPIAKAASLTGSIAHDWRDGASDRMEARIGVRIGL